VKLAELQELAGRDKDALACQGLGFDMSGGC
jgi:hypothetical protein